MNQCPTTLKNPDAAARRDRRTRRRSCAWTRLPPPLPSRSRRSGPRTSSTPSARIGWPKSTTSCSHSYKRCRPRLFLGAQPSHRTPVIALGDRRACRHVEAAPADRDCRGQRRRQVVDYGALEHRLRSTLACHLGFLTVLLAEGLGLGDSFLQRRDVGLQSLERTAFVRVFVRAPSGARLPPRCREPGQARGRSTKFQQPTVLHTGLGCRYGGGVNERLTCVVTFAVSLARAGRTSVPCTYPVCGCERSSRPRTGTGIGLASVAWRGPVFSGE